MVTDRCIVLCLFKVRTLPLLLRCRVAGTLSRRCQSRINTPILLFTVLGISVNRSWCDARNQMGLGWRDEIRDYFGAWLCLTVCFLFCVLEQLVLVFCRNALGILWKFWPLWLTSVVASAVMPGPLDKSRSFLGAGSLSRLIDISNGNGDSREGTCTK